MTTLITAAASNLILAIPLALLAYAVQRRGGYAKQAHLLWVLVLVKLVTPPLFAIPDFGASQWWASPHSSNELLTESPERIVAPGTVVAQSTLALAEELTDQSAQGQAAWVPVLAVFWLVGTVLVACVSLGLVLRFHRRLLSAISQAPSHVQQQAESVARRFGLLQVPTVFIVDSRISPLVWLVNGRVAIVLPEALLRTQSSRSIALVLAHEVSHIRRRDHLVRWFEWTMRVLFWWNPLSAWASRNIRLNEELCCDAMVLTHCEVERKDYATLLIDVIDCLAPPVNRPPAVACGFSSGGSTERRVRTIMKFRNTRRSPVVLALMGLTALACALPMGISFAQEVDAIQRRLGEAVAAGEITIEQANAMLKVLNHNATGDSSQSVSKQRDARVFVERAVDASARSVKENVENRFQYERQRANAELEKLEASRRNQFLEIRKLRQALAEADREHAENKWVELGEGAGQQRQELELQRRVVVEAKERELQALHAQQAAIQEQLAVVADNQAVDYKALEKVLQSALEQQRRNEQQQHAAMEERAVAEKVLKERALRLKALEQQAHELQQLELRLQKQQGLQQRAAQQALEQRELEQRELQERGLKRKVQEEQEATIRDEKRLMLELRQRKEREQALIQERKQRFAEQREAEERAKVELELEFRRDDSDPQGFSFERDEVQAEVRELKELIGKGGPSKVEALKKLESLKKQASESSVEL